MNVRDRTRLEDMARFASDAVELLGSLDAAALEHDIRSQYAVVRAIEIIGEAASHVTSETRSAYPGVPWKQIIGMRNTLIHAYHDLDLSTVVKTVREYLPPLIIEIECILGDHKA